jgi:hypothetical protein
MKHAKPSAPVTYFVQDGATTITDFHVGDKLLFVGDSYSDILYLGQLHDGLSFDTFTGEHFSVAAVDANHDGVTDTQIVGSDSIVTLLSVDPDSLYGWSLMGG